MKGEYIFSYIFHNKVKIFTQVCSVDRIGRFMAKDCYGLFPFFLVLIEFLFFVGFCSFLSTSYVFIKSHVKEQSHEELSRCRSLWKSRKKQRRPRQRRQNSERNVFDRGSITRSASWSGAMDLLRFGMQRRGNYVHVIFRRFWSVSLIDTPSFSL